jgi:hypothetical protein
MGIGMEFFSLSRDTPATWGRDGAYDVTVEINTKVSRHGSIKGQRQVMATLKQFMFACPKG